MNEVWSVCLCAILKEVWSLCACYSKGGMASRCESVAFVCV